ncbi:hypothetical protein HYW39_01780 [Candidatus Curtissbacteria bacterium]|nr:hypothetical protein [Candidatus Curtissbacteria bacterium]
MILKIDSTKPQEIVVELFDKKTGKRKKLTQRQKLGSQVLLPLVVKILKENKLTFSSLTEIRVNPGPGSFTGTRVGVAIANALGFALRIPVNGKKGKIAEPIYEKSKFDR